MVMLLAYTYEYQRMFLELQETSSIFSVRTTSTASEYCYCMYHALQYDCCHGTYYALFTLTYV